MKRLYTFLLAAIFLGMLGMSAATISGEPVEQEKQADAQKCNTKGNSSHSEVNKSVYKELPGEVMIVKRVGEKEYLLSMPTIKSREDLESYYSRGLERLRIATTKESDVAAIVTFSNPISEDEVKNIAGDLRIISLKYISKPVGIGEHPYPLTMEDRETLSKLEQDIAKTKKERDGIKGFKLIDGYISMKIKGNGGALAKLSEDPRVYLVDVGPMEEMQTGRFAKSLVLKDIYYEHKKYGS